MKVYKLINLDDNRIYIGSTTRNLNTRFNEHKSFSKSGKSRCSCNTFNFDNVKMELLEEVNENLKEKELEYILKYDCVNKDYPIATPERKKEQLKKSRMKLKIKYKCDCGSIISKGEKARHERSKKHNQIISSTKSDKCPLKLSDNDIISPSTPYEL